MASHKILVIDDSKVIQKTVKNMLPPGNFQVVEATDGEIGLKKIKEENPSLIMLDFLLPKKSGWEVFQEIQKSEKLRAIPLLLMSGRKEEVTEKIPEPFEYFEFIGKPFEKKQLLEAIKATMKKANANAKANAKAKIARQTPASKSKAVAAVGKAEKGGDEVAALKAQIAQMQSEINGLKKQVSQILAFIKQKLK